ncbi:methyltransferase domain-containing protein [Chelatococcus sp. SYSU_G07232]|uniref:Methyltransferase domain-containing protein n=1 Tax=Chelatococcus albus TaxID=3047466 RepID=A0ABT7AIM3_9HYPH|nr:methyltransferase domain-containing protein [Chelatococcus sp. SYSU_G07232]MDJ1159225.1 methyltransferase domain-containing protein [Chelatococcus sp. SYSU_G07232]
MNWRDFWNSDTPIYVSERHKLLHYRLVARDLATLVPSPDATVLDYGCGEALAADEVARHASSLILCDQAPLVRDRLKALFGANPKISVRAPEEIEALPSSSLDLVVMNSLVQYLSRTELEGLLRLWKDKLKSTGLLVIADVVPPKVSPVTDAAALLSFALRGGFLLAAVAGLVRTFFSDYRKIRGRLGLSQYEEADLLALLGAAGFSAERWRPNLGHNQARMTFLARPA